WASRLASRAALRSFGTSGRFRAASWSLRRGVGAPLPSRGWAGLAWSMVSWGVGASFLRPNTSQEYRTGRAYPPAVKHRPGDRLAGIGARRWAGGRVAAMTNVNVQQLAAAVDSDMGRTISSLEQLVSIPGIAWAAFDPQDLVRSADAVAGLVRELGLEDVQILSVPNGDSDGGPAVVARRPAAAGQPTVLLYAHHDVQPPGDPAPWRTEPFKATEIDGRLYGRGAADDKAGIMVHLASLRALLEVLGDDFGVGVTFFFEGEEEAGSPTFRTFLETHRESLRADAIIVADSSNWKVGVPALTTSLRGLVDGTVELR